MPKLASSTQWRVIAKHKRCSTIADVVTPLWSSVRVTPKNRVLNFTKKLLPKSLPSIQKCELALFTWFTDEKVIVANQNPLILGDGRFTVGDNPIYSLWGIELIPEQQHIKKVSFPEIKEVCD
jgi:inner membrane protein